MSRYKIKRKIRKGRVCGCLQYSHLIDVFNGMKRDNDFCSNNHLVFDQSNLHHILLLFKKGTEQFTKNIIQKRKFE